MGDNDDYNNDEEGEDVNDDALYDEELEEDRGDIEEEEEEDSRYDRFEELADIAAMRGVDMVEPMDSSTSLKARKGSGKGRGATKGLRVTEPMHLKFDTLYRPMGIWRLKYGQQIGFCMRKLNVNWNWRDVSDGKKKLMWEDTMNLFHIPDDKRLRRNFLSAVAKRFRAFKSKLVSGWITNMVERTKSEVGREPPEIWKHITEEDWKLFKQIKTSSPAKRKRVMAIANAKKNEHYHHLGQNDFSTAREIWIKDGFYPGCTSTSVETSTTNIDINRADDWYCAMHSKDKETSSYTIKKPKTKEVAEKYLELREKQTRGELIPVRNKDALYYALGEKDDHPSRARGFGGVNVTVNLAFGTSTSKIGGSRNHVTLSEDREALKNELREELRNEMKLEVRTNVSSILQELGLSAAKLPNIPDASGDVNQPAVNNTCTDFAEINHLKPSPPPEIKNDTPCRLLLKDPHSGVLYEVARGRTFPGEVCHQSVVGPDQVRVKVSIVPEEFETLPLPVPVPAYDLHLLREAVGSLVLWPISLVRLENEGGQNDTRHEVMGSNSHHSRLSVTPEKTRTREFMVESLSPDCQWLNTLVGTMVDGENYNVYFDARLFYYNEDVKAEVYKDDLKQFLEGNELNISIIQIFIRALHDDLLKADTRSRIGWLCPDSTSDTKLIKKVEVAITYVANAFKMSALNGDEFIIAPIINSKHWVLLVICLQTYTIYEFDPITLKEGRKLYVQMVVLSALRRYKMSGGQIKVKRKEPLWKSMKCPQQTSCMENGYFVMRFMYDILKNCTTANDWEKVWNSHREESYTICEINEIRDKWATYFTSRCVS